MLVVLGGNYLLATQLGRIWQRPARAWINQVHRWGGPWFASYCRRHGALLIKVGQVVASRPDVLPLAYVDACAPLRDQAPARSFAVVKRALERAYEGRVAEHLQQIDEVPLAAASFGQVHRARLNDGTEVAVKIQYPDLGARVALDLILLRLALRLITLATPGWPTHLLYEEIARTSREEQDYLAEALAAERLRPLLARRRVSVPRVFLAHTRDTVLVMEFARGRTLAATDLSQLTPAVRTDLASRIIDAWLDMALEEGFFHGDPHAGNFIYAPDAQGGQLWLIDFGMTATLPPEVRGQYTRFLVRLAAEDTDGMVDVLAELGVLLPGADLGELKALARELYTSLGQLNPRAFKGSRREAELSAKVTSFLRRSRGIAFPRHTIILGRALGLIEGITGALVPDQNLLSLAKPRLLRLGNLRGRLRDLLAEVTQRWQRLTGLPDRVEAALRARPQQDHLPIVAGIVLIAAFQVPEPYRPWAVGAAGLAVLRSVLRR